LTVATVHGTEGRLDDALRVAKAQLQTLRFTIQKRAEQSTAVDDRKFMNIFIYENS
jgi:hypothetical protein